MPTESETTTTDKQITVAVPEDRVAEFYAFYGRFLAGPRPSHRGGRRGRHHGCGPHRHEARRADEPVQAEPQTREV
jgi:hypothetical protein